MVSTDWVRLVLGSAFVALSNKYLVHTGQSAMRAYHFLSEEHALLALRNQRLKVATLNELNDPFELLAGDLADRSMRQSFQKWKQNVSKNLGLLSFSQSWHNPLLWSHYANRHHGVTLQFDLDDDIVVPIKYRKTRMPIDLDKIRLAGGFSAEMAEDLATTKSPHWAYEKEVRIFVSLSDCVYEDTYWFEKFGPQLYVSGILCGPLSNLSALKISKSLPKGHSIDVRWTRLAFRSFRVVANRSKKTKVVTGALA